MKLLCDADVIIEAHKTKVWRYLVNTHEVFIGSVVANKECIYYIDTYQKRFIDLKQEAKTGKVSILTAFDQELSRVVKKVNKYKLVIHSGETESIALMLNPKYKELVFCTADRAAVKAAYLFDLSTRVVSLECCLGKTAKVKLPYKCTEKAMDRSKTEAIQYFDSTE